jgi:glycerol-3-phosphate dehydrogenase (NAD(P)+)
MTAKERVAVLGAGSWGATIASFLTEKDHSVVLWNFDEKDAEKMRTTRRLAVLPDLQLPPALEIKSGLVECLENRLVIVCALPSHVVRASMRAARACGALSPEAIFVNASKGLEEKTHEVMSEVIRQELRVDARALVVLSGPSHAEEVCRKLPTAVVASGCDPTNVRRVQDLFNTAFLRVYAQSDPLGVELAGALKNVYAIACGVSDGLGFGDNTRAAIMTRGLNEMVRIGTKMGADLLTFFGLAGMGDLAVTCLSRHSRNHLLGEKIGKGQSAEAALASMTMVAEGYRSASSAFELAERFGLDCPLTRETYEILYRGKSPRVSLQDLMLRTPHDEWRGATLESGNKRS